jgi:hypothetical protein
MTNYKSSKWTQQALAAFPSFSSFPQRKVLFSMGAAVLLTSVLSACGGGGSSSTGSGTTQPPGAPSTMAPGVYLGTKVTVDGVEISKDWVSMVLPTSPASTGNAQFYALHYNAADPDIYSGTGQVVGKSSATISSLLLYHKNATSARTGTGSLSSPSNGVVRAELNFAATTLAAKTISLDHSAPSGYIANTPATLSAVQGTWQGLWSYGVGSADNYSISVSAQGIVSSLAAFQNDCQITQSAFTPNFDGTNLFGFTLTIPNATQCTLKNQTLTGAAFVMPSPVAGKTQRLYLVGVATDGRGISFKADR